MNTNETLANIARTHLDIETLETRGSDRLDFHTVSAAALKRALEAAYLTGVNAAAARLIGAAIESNRKPR